MDKDTALRKIRKCLALSGSNEPNEAARALAQAQALMREFEIDHPELLASAATHEWAKSRAKIRPPDYEVHMANVIAAGFGCELLFTQQWQRTGLAGGYSFIGIAPAPEIAGYTFTVLARMLTRARSEYSAVKLKRHRKNKVALADAYCQGWAIAACEKVLPNKPAQQQAAAIAAYSAQRYPSVSEARVRSRELSVRVQEKADRHALSGYIDGEQVAVQPGVGGAVAPLQLGLSGLQ